MKIQAIKDIQDGWNVWATLEGHHPIHDPSGFVIGSGETKAEAAENAIKELQNAIEKARELR